MLWGKSPERQVVMPAGAFQFLKNDIEYLHGFFQGLAGLAKHQFGASDKHFGSLEHKFSCSGVSWELHWEPMAALAGCIWDKHSIYAVFAWFFRGVLGWPGV